MQNWELKPAQDIELPLGRQFQSVRRECGLVNSMTHLAWASAVKFYLSVVHRLSIEGRENLPVSGPYVLVSNHCSHLDSLALSSAVSWRLQSRVFPVAAGDTFFSTPLVGTLSALLINALPMWRGRSCSHGMADLRHRLMEEGCVFVVFPEGTRSRTGKMGAFRAGVGMLVAGTDAPVVPCRLVGTFAAMPFNRRIPRPGKLRLSIGEPISFAGVANDRAGWQSIAGALESAVAALGGE
jgi:1-acyl-sn-glycerol-3-phosphate acyltransferase